MNVISVNNDDYPYQLVSFEYEEWLNNRHLYAQNQPVPEEIAAYRTYAQGQGILA